jgi:hypothetical protein
MKGIRNQKIEKKQKKYEKEAGKPFSPATDAAHSPTNLTRTGTL